MSKPLAGKRAFEAMGRSDQARGLTIMTRRTQRNTWPEWAQRAYSEGWFNQANKRIGRTA